MPVTLADDDLDRFITVAEAAARLRIHKDTAYAWIRDGKFPVPVVEVVGRKRVSLRRLAEYMNGTELERRAS